MKDKNTIIISLIIFGLLVASILAAAVYPVYQIISELPADEEVVFSVCAPNAKRCEVKALATCLDCPGDGRPLPPVGRVCRLVGAEVLDCGKKYQRLEVRY